LKLNSFFTFDALEKIIPLTLSIIPLVYIPQKNRFFSSPLIPFARYGTSKKAVTPRTQTTSSWATTSIAAKSLWKRSSCCLLTKLNIQKISFFSEETTSVQGLTGQFYHQH
jgi:hypothetical protein